MATEHADIPMAILGTEKTPFVTADLPTPEASPTFPHNDAPTVHLINIPTLSDDEHDTETDTPAPPYDSNHAPVHRILPTAEELPADPLTSSLLQARTSHMARLASMYAEMELAAREHDAHLSSIFQAEIATLQSQLAAGAAEQKALKQRLVEITEHKKMELLALRTEMAAAKAAFDNELEARRREAQLQLEGALADAQRRAEEELAEDKAWSAEELAGEKARFAEELVAEKTRAAEELEALRKAEEERVNTLLKEMGHEADERVRAVQSEMMLEMEGKVKALSEEMERMKREFASEREINARAMKILAAKEAEARERLEKRGELKQPLQAWAVARLWGVGQSRSR
ncbi:hypothetical protein OQA88_658 [Cercophora sp. LCS_1]